MRRRAVMACGVVALAIALVPGCALFGRKDRDDPSPSQVMRRQELSEAAQAAVDRRDLAGARSLLDLWLAENARSAEGHMRLGQVLPAPGARLRRRRGRDAATRHWRSTRIAWIALIGLGPDPSTKVGHDDGNGSSNGSPRRSRSTRRSPRRTSPRGGRARGASAGRWRHAASYFRAPGGRPRRRLRRSSAWRRSSSRCAGTSRTRRFARLDQAAGSPPTTPRRTTAGAWPTWR